VNNLCKEIKNTIVPEGQIHFDKEWNDPEVVDTFLIS